MNEKEWLKKAILIVIKQRHLKSESMADMIMEMIESYEAMKEV
jgi:hypothetical protein